ncbi:hypothetical protein F4553_006672 [Allocatelliglobosispora scoriae]|uniref:Uncharacterized protein n=1 Tax=Allocatelliglobosispora scoriae TaxID=643052 RepID=A0A841C0G9_9ACTN|nr:hypothetical protein [Allocatelliglobosispora scoriae]MBB5873238.1 hypothetical protein [Allocatelliglobosispora scoriae]
MHHANHFYGHAHVLARYCGLDLSDGQDPPKIEGYVQHGWNIGDGLAPGHPYAERTPIFAWSERVRRTAWSMGKRNVVVIGAPWIYLQEVEPELGAVPEAEREGTIYYPFHGWEGGHVKGDHGKLIEQIKDVETGPVTVCLYWQEYRTPKVRRRYENAGFRIVSHGYRGHWWKDTDPHFLTKQLVELRRHRRIASNRVSSALFYGIASGCEPAVYGNPMTLQGEDPAYGGVPRIRRQWPELHGVAPDVETARQLAAAELGKDFRCSPEELRHLLGWARTTEVAR